MISICQGRRRSPLEAARGFWLPLVFESKSSRYAFGFSAGLCMEQNQTFICGLGCFHRHRRLSLDSSAGLETIKSEASEFLPCPVRDRAKSGRSRCTTSTSFACSTIGLKQAFRGAVRSFVRSDPPLKGRPQSFLQPLRCRGYDWLSVSRVRKGGRVQDASEWPPWPPR